MRFFGLVAMISLFLGMIYFTVFFWGQGRNFVPYENQFLSQKKPWIFVRNQNWIQVEQDKSGLLRIAKSPLEVSQWLEKNKPEFLFLEVMNNKSQIHEQITALIPKTMVEHVLLQSEYEVILKSLKDLNPRWAFGSSSADRLRWKTFDSLGLAGAVNFSRDVYVAPLKDQNGFGISAGIISELRRRKLPFIVGPLKKSSEVEEALLLNADGYLLEKPDLRPQIH